MKNNILLLGFSLTMSFFALGQADMSTTESPPDIESEFIVLDSDKDTGDIPEVEDRVSLKTSFIKGNKELPQVLYIVPWQTIKQTEKKPENLVLHSLYGDIFNPILPQ